MMATVFVPRPDAANVDRSPADAAGRLLDRLHAFTTVAFDACAQEDVGRLETVVEQRGEILVELERVLANLGAPDGGQAQDLSMELLARRIRAFEVLEAKLVSCVRRLRDDIQEALDRAARGRTAVAGYRRTASPAPAGRYAARSV